MSRGRLRSVNWRTKLKSFAPCALGLTGVTVAGLAAPSDNAAEVFTPKERAHWAFHELAHPKPPKVEETAWVRNSIDSFVLAGLEAKGLKPAPPTDKITLIRRATFDL